MSTEPVGILFDMLCCVGCRACVRACMEIHGFEGEANEVTDLSATACTSMTDKDGSFLRNLCRHCVDPSCASACPVGALRKTDLGPVVYDVDRCIGCRYCMVACPFDIPRYEWDDPVPAIRKCDMCIDRIEEGGQPACAAACPFGATIFGTRTEILEESHSRIAEDPDEYYDHVYGEEEIGGTSVVFLTPEPEELLGYKEILGREPLPGLTRRHLERVPAIVVGGGAAMLAIWWITNRRDEVARAEGRGHAGDGIRGKEKGDSHGRE